MTQGIWNCKMMQAMKRCCFGNTAAMEHLLIDSLTQRVPAGGLMIPIFLFHEGVTSFESSTHFEWPEIALDVGRSVEGREVSHSTASLSGVA
jgi:hypothetical protein